MMQLMQLPPTLIFFLYTCGLVFGLSSKHDADTGSLDWTCDTIQSKEEMKGDGRRTYEQPDTIPNTCYSGRKEWRPIRGTARS